MDASGAEFGTHADYGAMNRDVHRKPATPLGVPSLNCHLAFRRPKDVLGGRGEWINNIDKYLCQLFLLLRSALETADPAGRIFDLQVNANRIEPAATGEAHDVRLMAGHIRNDVYVSSSSPNATAFETVFFRFSWQSSLIRLRAELHDEFWTLTTSIDLSAPEHSGGQSKRPKSETMWRDGFSKLRDLLSVVDDGKDNERRKKFKSLQVLYRLFYAHAWQRVFRNLLLSKTLPSPKNSVWAAAAPDLIGAVFADFRGLVLARHQDDHGAEMPPSDSLIEMPASRQSGRPWRVLAPSDARLKNDAAQRLIAKFWPFLNSDYRTPKINAEYTASLMLDGRALYLSTLGAPLSPFKTQRDGDAEPRRRPLHYFVYANCPMRWELGRLVDRLHQLGAIRLAAIFDLQKLQQAAESLRDLAQRADGLIQKRSESTLFQSISKLQTALSEVDVSVGYAGLSYRIERSRYYAAEFRSQTQYLEIRSIDGFQPYDGFVERRVGAMFNFVDRLGKSYEHLSSQLTLLQQFNATDQTNQQATATERNTKQLIKIQEVGEVLFFFALAPYYLMGINHYDLFKPLNIPDLAIVSSCWAASAIRGILFLSRRGRH